MRYWALAFWATAAAAFAGGIAHGFADRLSEEALGGFVWKVVVLSIGGASFFFLSGTSQSLCSRRWAKAVHAVALAKFGIYSLWMLSHDDFVYVIYDYLPSLLAVAAIGVWAYRTAGLRAGLRIAQGVAVSLAGALVQMSGFALHRHFNHNDLYHVIQMVGLWLLYIGAKDLPDRRREAAAPASIETA